MHVYIFTCIICMYVCMHACAGECIPENDTPIDRSVASATVCEDRTSLTAGLFKISFASLSLSLSLSQSFALSLPSPVLLPGCAASPPCCQCL